MEIIYGEKIPIVAKKEKTGNQIVRRVKDDVLIFRIILTNETCRGSTKPMVSITNQLTKKLGLRLVSCKDYMRKDLTMERILTFNT